MTAWGKSDLLILQFILGRETRIILAAAMPIAADDLRREL